MAQTPAPANQFLRATSSLTFDVRTVANGGGSNFDRKAPAGGQNTNLGSTTRTRTSQTSLELKVRNLSAAPASGDFEYYFVAQGLAKSKPYIYCTGKKSMTVGGGQEQKEVFQSTELVQVTTQQTGAQTVSQPGQDPYTQITAASQKSGARPVGWIVRQMVDGKVVRVQASSSEYEQAGSNPGALAVLENNAPKAAAPGQRPGVPAIPGFPQR